MREAAHNLDVEEDAPDSDDEGEIDWDGAPSSVNSESDQEQEPEAGIADGDMKDAQDTPMPDTTGSDVLEAAKAQLQAQYLDTAEEASASDDFESIQKQTFVLLDMIITIVGEFFGQRDLLVEREVWSS
ncbi:hypothetical protein N7470_010213 [Penicillium chermesinum]|nr:hypothetical protein N7470_010213 [Penicillium chermesinum]